VDARSDVYAFGATMFVKLTGRYPFIGAWWTSSTPRSTTLRAWHEAYAAAVARLAEEGSDGCRAACDGILHEEPDREEIWKLRGDAMRLAGDLDGARASYDRAIEIRRSDWESLDARAEVSRRRGDRAAARADLERACAIQPRFAGGLALAALTHLDEARALAYRAIATDLASYAAAVALAEIEIERGRDGHGEAPFAAALDALARAGALPGCQNRVSLLVAQANLGVARSRVARAADPAEAIDVVRRLCAGAAANVENSAPWESVRAELARMAAAGGRC
jgi:tetratricopeptide (TPR) repeat protein